MIAFRAQCPRLVRKRLSHTIRPFSASALRCSSKEKPSDRYNYNEVSFEDDTEADYSELKTVTANDLESHKVPPTRAKMLVRDFIEDSLYNPNYGYFPKQAVILDTPTERGFEFGRLRDAVEFQEEVGKRYNWYHQFLDAPGKHVWHTPTELFQPFYGQAIAQCLVSEYLLKYFPYEDFVVYEIGAGNGTLAMNILDYIQREYPEVYDRTQYHIVEISARLAHLQKKRLTRAHPCVTVENKSVFHWDRKESAPCFFMAMEVVDNFAHDLIRYDIETLEPRQGWVGINSDGDFSIHYTRVTDPLISKLLSVRRRLSHVPSGSWLYKANPTLRRFYKNLPFAPNLSPPEYLPTRLLSLLFTLRNYFPRHRLLLSDFCSLPDTIPGANAPVVQTRVNNVTIPCSTLLVKQGYFDIFFPTNFEWLRDMYEYVLESEDDPSEEAPYPSTSLGTGFFSSAYLRNRRLPHDGVVSATGLPIGERKSNVFRHEEFLRTYADLNKTRLRNGENPMLDFYQNVKFLF